MNARKLNNPSIKRVLKLLMTGKEYSTLTIVQGAGVCAVSAIISEIRSHGIGIDCNRRDGRFYYKLGKYLRRHNLELV